MQTFRPQPTNRTKDRNALFPVLSFVRNSISKHWCLCIISSAYHEQIGILAWIMFETPHSCGNETLWDACSTLEIVWKRQRNGKRCYFSDFEVRLLILPSFTLSKERRHESHCQWHKVIEIGFRVRSKENRSNCIKKIVITEETFQYSIFESKKERYSLLNSNQASQFPSAQTRTIFRDIIRACYDYFGHTIHSHLKMSTLRQKEKEFTPNLYSEKRIWSVDNNTIMGMTLRWIYNSETRNREKGGDISHTEQIHTFSSSPERPHLTISRFGIDNHDKDPIQFTRAKCGLKIAMEILFLRYLFPFELMRRKGFASVSCDLILSAQTATISQWYLSGTITNHVFRLLFTYFLNLEPCWSLPCSRAATSLWCKS